MTLFLHCNIPSARAFLSGHDDAVVLDFNVDGPVYDLIPAL
nr:MAG TPA: hypothetical protein [Caudoviricetes sp.]